MSEPSVSRFEVDVADEGDSAPVVRCSGELDVAGAPDLRSALYPLLDAGRDAVVDLGALEFIDSSGIGVLVGAHKRARERGHDIRLRGASGPVDKVLRITGLHEVIPSE